MGERPTRKVEYSLTESTHVLKYEDINGAGRLFGGKLMAWIDETGGYTAMRHSGSHVVTASVDNLQFKRGAVLNEMVVLVGRLVYVGSTSMEVRVDSYIEKEDGMRYPINRAYVTYVAADSDGKPKRIPYDIELETEAQRAEWNGALKRKKNREKRRNEGF